MVLQRTIPLAASLSAASLSAAALLAAGLCVGACSSGGTHGEGVVDSSVSSDVAIDGAGAPGAIEV